MRKAIVKIHNKKCGFLYETDQEYVFEYDNEYLKDPNAVSISMRLPISKKIHRSNVLFPFFDGLIPEGWILNIYVTKWKLDITDRFGLLLKLTQDPIGAVSIEEIK